MGGVSATVVIAARNEGENLVDTLDCALQNAGRAACDAVVVDDGSTDACGELVARRFGDDCRVSLARTGGVGVACARNAGARLAAGDHLVFLDAHCYTPAGWLDALLEPFADPEVRMAGPAIANLRQPDAGRGLGAMWDGPELQARWLEQRAEEPYAVPLHLGGCLAMRRDDFFAAGEYDAGMPSWGSEAEELSLRVWLLGGSVVVQPRCVVYHLFREAQPYVTQPLHVLHNRLRMACLHFGRERLGRVLKAYAGSPGFVEALTLLLVGDVMDRRCALRAAGARDDDWFFQRFGELP